MMRNPVSNCNNDCLCSSGRWWSSRSRGCGPALALLRFAVRRQVIIPTQRIMQGAGRTCMVPECNYLEGEGTR